jgi:hypothetical protein
MSKCKLEFGDVVEYLGDEYYVIDTITYENKIVDTFHSVSSYRVVVHTKVILHQFLEGWKSETPNKITVDLSSDIVFKRSVKLKIIEV